MDPSARNRPAGASRTRSAVLATVLALLAATAAACGAGDGSVAGDAASSATPASGPALVACSDMPYEPFEFERDGETTGFDVELADALAEHLGRTATFRPTALDDFDAELQAGGCDLVASAFVITEERRSRFAFTDPYLDVDQAVVVPAGAAAATPDLAALAGRRIGVVSGTTGADLVAAQLPDGASLVEQPTAAELRAALGDGRVDAGVLDAPVADHWILDDPSLAVTQRLVTGEQYGFAVAPASTELLAQLDAALVAVRADGTYDEIRSRWFGTPTAPPGTAPG